MHESDAKARKEAELDTHVKAVVDRFPDLTPEQREQLALLLHPEADPQSLREERDLLVDWLRDLYIQKGQALTGSPRRHPAGGSPLSRRGHRRQTGPRTR